MSVSTTISNTNIALGSIAERIFASGQITHADNNALMRIALERSILSPEEEEHIKKMFNRLQMGLLKVVD